LAIRKRGREMTDNGHEDLIKGPWSWTAEDIKLLKRLYPRGNTRMIAEKLCRPLTAVRQKAYDMGMKTEVYHYWTEDDLDTLSELYPNTGTDELARRFRRSAGSVKTKARQLGLKKSEDYIKEIKSRPRKRRKNKR
jgi:hypothetical protein